MAPNSRNDTCGIIDSGLKERLLREDYLTLDKCLQLCSKTLAGGHTVEKVHRMKQTARRDTNTVSSKYVEIHMKGTRTSVQPLENAEK